MIGLPHIRTVCLVLFLMMGQASVVFPQQRELVSASSGCENFLYISGESNVSPFSFRYNRASLTGKNKTFYPDTTTLEISIPIRDFEPSNPMMMGDFLALLKESEYPRIYVTFSTKQLHNFGSTYSGFNPEIRITIAGITKTYKIPCSLANCSDYLYLSGEKMIHLTDFRLQPPEKLLGLVKVHNEIKVNFGFIITFTNNNPISAKL